MGLSVMVVGSGGREHALAWALAFDEAVDRVVAAPGNPGIASLPKTTTVDADPSDIGALADLAEAERIDLTVVGPEKPLAEGLADYFHSRKLSVFGPKRNCARLESSKWFAKQVMKRYGVPTPDAVAFEGEASFPEAERYIRGRSGPWVIKADGLAAGKGVLVTDDADRAVNWARACLVEGKFGPSGRRVLIEEYAPGKEASVLVVSDGKDLVPLPPARDYKRLEDGDEGPNTGGMGAFSPVPEIDETTLDGILEKIFEPVLDAMRKEAEPFLGVLYGGLVLTEEGPKVLEFNVRFGDPEAQAVIPRIGPGLASVIDCAMSGNLDQARVDPVHAAGVTVVAAASGYPENPRTGDPIEGIEAAADRQDVVVFHAGTRLTDDGRLATAGGRVLAVSGVGGSIHEARQKAYEAISEIHFDGMHYRRDIAAVEGG